MSIRYLVALLGVAGGPGGFTGSTGLTSPAGSTPSDSAGPAPSAGVVGTAGDGGSAPTALADDAAVELGVTLSFPQPAAVEGYLRDLQDPTSPSYRRYLSPAEVGQRFGRSAAELDRVVSWLAAAGFQVERYPNQVFLHAVGTAGGARQLVGSALVHADGQPAGVHLPAGRLLLPDDIAAMALQISGLDTRPHLRHRLVGDRGNTFGPQDLRAQYGLLPLFAAGYTGQGQRLMVLSTALPPGREPSAAHINYFLHNLADARVRFQSNVLPNASNDFEQQTAATVEYELDVEMQSVGAPGAESITLEVSPASQVFSLGAEDIANHFPGVTAVSVSLGTCEPVELQLAQQAKMDEVGAFRVAIQTGVLGGQTWSAATGDTGSDDCRNGSSPAVDFPASVPEVIAAGGVQLAPAATFDGHAAILAYQPEVVWNDNGGAAGGGASIIFPAPPYQSNLPTNDARLLPDLALIAGPPGAATVSTAVGLISEVEGTSVASPLSAGFFALIASRVGCRLGQPHANLYALGGAQAAGQSFDAGAPFHDILSGDVSLDGVAGAAAGPGFDQASGWGSLNVAALAAAWPPCAADGGLGFDGGPLTPEVYAQCAFLACDGGTACVTLPEGPSGCVQACALAGSSCPPGGVCTAGVLYATADAGVCLPGCSSDADCGSQPGTRCDLCLQLCAVPGPATARVGDGCKADGDCPTGGQCLPTTDLGGFYPGGYCTLPCDLSGKSAACTCPEGSACLPSAGSGGAVASDGFCNATCPAPGHGCERSGYQCQPQGNGVDVCAPGCQVVSVQGRPFDTCQLESGLLTNSPQACDSSSGVCGGPRAYDAGLPLPDGGDAGAEDAGEVGSDGGGGQPGDGGVRHDAGREGGFALSPAPGGCGCSPGSRSLDGPAAAMVAFMAALRGRRRKSGKGPLPRRA